jgi:hypothetical protein
MSRAGLYGSLLAAAAFLFVVSCERSENLAISNTRGSVRIEFTCKRAVGKFGLKGDNGGPAWKAERRQGEYISWIVKEHVTINSIRNKDGTPIPVNVTHSPTQPGDSLVGTVQGAARTYPYDIDVTCQQNGNTVRLIIDPEMIVR